MTRTEFITAYATRSRLSNEWAELGFVQAGSRVMIALPCTCGAEECEGWAMLSNENVLTHLDLYTPEQLRFAYHDAVKQKGI